MIIQKVLVVSAYTVGVSLEPVRRFLEVGSCCLSAQNTDRIKNVMKNGL